MPAKITHVRQSNLNVQFYDRVQFIPITKSVTGCSSVKVGNRYGMYRIL